MKLLRFGNRGQEKPGALDSKDKSVISPASLPTLPVPRCYLIRLKGCGRSISTLWRSLPGLHGLVLALALSVRFSASVSTTPITPPNQAWQSPPNRYFS
jgi:hypothetical protein